MNPEHAKIVSDYLAATLEQEGKTTQRVIAAIPATGYDYTPDAKSMKALDLAWHLAGAEIMLLDMALAGGDAAMPERPAGTETPDGIAAWYAKAQADTLAKVKALSGDHLAKVVTVWGGMMTLPTVNFVTFALNHTTHHRGQLSTYLRPAGGKCPSIYGPSADEPMPH